MRVRIGDNEMRWDGMGWDEVKWSEWNEIVLNGLWCFEWDSELSKWNRGNPNRGLVKWRRDNLI